MGKSKLVFSLILAMFMGACSDGPEQYNRGSVNLPTGDVSSNNDIGNTFIPENFPSDRNYKIGRIEVPFEVPAGDDVDDALVKANSSQPLVYKKGFAGITFDTTFDEAKNILSEPLGNNSDGAYFYREGLIVIWRTQDPRIPVFVIARSDYLGKMKVGSLGEIGVGDDLTSYFSSDDGTGVPTAKKFFNELEGKSADYDCIASKECQVKGNETFYLFIFPGSMFLISKDRLVMAEIRLTREISPGNLDNNFDIVNQSISYQNTEENTESINLGQSWGELKDQINGDGIETNSTDSFQVEYNGTILLLTKDDFGRSYKKAQDTESLKAFYHVGDFTKNFMANGKFVSYSYDLSTNQFKFSKSDQVNESKTYLYQNLGNVDSYRELETIKTKASGEIEFPIIFADDSSIAINDMNEFTQVQNDLIQNQPAAQLLSTKVNHFNEIQKHMIDKQSLSIDEKKLKRDFFNSLNAFIENEFKQDPAMKVVSRSSGLFNEERESSISHFVMKFDETSGKGNLIEYSMSNMTGHLSYVYSGLAEADFNQVIFPHVTKDINFENGKKAKALLGFELGQNIKIKEIDNGREEATVYSLDESLKERSGFDDTALRTVIYNSDAKELKESHQSVSVGDLGVSFYVSKDTKQDEYKIVQINSSSVFGKINGLCGLNSLDLKIAMSAKEVQAKINSEISKAKQANNNFNCVKFEKKTSDGSGQLSSISFPNERVKLYFSDNQLSSLGIYAAKNEVFKSEGQ